jgi:hypothetical protein
VNKKERKLGVGLAIALGIAGVLSLFFSLTPSSGQEGEPKPAKVEFFPEVVIESRWLVLDSARPVEQVLPEVLDTLAVLQSSGGVLSYDDYPQTSAPGAVPCLQVMAQPGDWSRLLYLPGVLAITNELPPPPVAPLNRGVQSSGQVSGVVRNHHTGLPVENILVYIYDAVSYTTLGFDYTDFWGNYQVDVTAAFDQVKVRFYGDIDHWFAPTWYDGKSYFSTADAIPLPDGGVVEDIDADLVRTGQIVGTVSFEGSGEPAIGVVIDVFQDDGNRVSWAETDADGDFTIRVPAGDYHLNLWSRSIAPEWYQDADTQGEATSVNVISTEVTTILAEVAPAGWITGRVTSEDTGLALVPAHNVAVVLVFDRTGDMIDLNFADPDGYFAIGGMGTDDYGVYFQDDFDMYDDEFYNDQKEYGAADFLAVTAGMTLTNIDASLKPISSFGTISGTIKEVSFLVISPLDVGEDIYVMFHDADTHELVQWLEFEGNGTDVEYQTQLPVGYYRVLFAQKSDTPKFYPEWYNNHQAFRDSEVVTVTAGMTTPNISAIVTNPFLATHRGCIEGILTDAGDGSGLPGARVEIYPEYGEYYYLVKTNLDGEYQLCNLLGNYEVYFEQPAYIPEWHDNVFDRSDAISVTVTGGVTETIDAQLILGGCVSGRISDMHGTYLPWAYVDVYDQAGEKMWLFSRNTWMSSISVHEDGYFIGCGLRTGEYTLRCELDDLTGQVPVSINAGELTSGAVCVLAGWVYLPLVER